MSLIGYLNQWITALEQEKPSWVSYFHATTQSYVEDLLNSEISVSKPAFFHGKPSWPGAFVSNFPEYG